MKSSYILFFLLVFLNDINLFAKDPTNLISLQMKAFTSNAGGQNAYSLRLANDDREWSAFMNQDLYAGSFPLMGAAYSIRFPLCGIRCAFDAYIQTGLGGSSAGPLAEFIWGLKLFYVIRIDFALHIIAQRRIILLGYPLWTGVSIPI